MFSTLIRRSPRSSSKKGREPLRQAESATGLLPVTRQTPPVAFHKKLPTQRIDRRASGGDRRGCGHGKGLGKRRNGADGSPTGPTGPYRMFVSVPARLGGGVAQ